MVTLNDKRSLVLKHAIKIAGQVLNLETKNWFAYALDTCTKEDWSITSKLNDEWIASSQTPLDEDKLYTSDEYVLDICKCYTHYTKSSIKQTINGIVDLRKEIPNFGDGWTFVDYFAGVGLSSIYLAQQLQAAGINANVIYHNSVNNKSQVALAKRFIEEFGSPKNLSVHLKSTRPKGDCYLFYEVFEHMREPWSFVSDLLKTERPKCIVHVSRFNLPNFSGHFKNYTIEGVVYSGKKATREFESHFKNEGYVRTIIPQQFNGTPSVHIHKSLIPNSVSIKNSKWDLKSQLKLQKLNMIP